MTGDNSLDQGLVFLHLYGSAMTGFQLYDREQATRQWMEVTHNES